MRFERASGMTQATPQHLPGTRPEGTHDEHEAAAHVQRMFGEIAPRYDLLNHLLSLDIDKVWRKRVARKFRNTLQTPGARVLDVCCGTGDLAFAFSRTAGSQASITGSDFVPEMLVRARAKAIAQRLPVEFTEADALQLPFSSDLFDLVSCAFGFRNLANYQRGLQEIYRVLAPGGSAAILEFAEPPGAVFGALYRFYFRQILPRLGGLVSGNSSAYAYLPRSVSRFPSPEMLQDQFQQAGFIGVSFERWTGGMVTLHTARKPQL